MAGKGTDGGASELSALTETDPQKRISLLGECYARHFSENLKNEMRLKDMALKLRRLIDALKKVEKATAHPKREESGQIILTYLVAAGKLWNEIMDEIRSWED